MTQMLQRSETANRLRRVIAGNSLPGSFRTQAERVIGQLERPTCITAIGRRGSGKTTLLNVILCEEKMPDLSGVTLIELIHGDVARFTLEHRTGEQEHHDGIAGQTGTPLRCFRITQQLPLPQLRDKRLAEINLPRVDDDLDAVLDWMTRNTDIAIWCSQGFDDAEFAIWSLVPDALKDHSFLTLTKADQLLAQGALSDSTARFEQSFTDEFLCLFPLATRQALSACFAGAISDEATWINSGGAAFLQGITRQIETGKMAILDQADILLVQCGASALDGIAAEEEPSSDDQSEAVSTDQISPMKDREAIETALTVLQAPVAEMLRSYSDAPPPASIVLEHTAQAAQALATLFMDAGAEDEQINALRDEIVECEQMVQLLQLEGTETAAYDAATALLQLKKDMSEMAYA